MNRQDAIDNVNRYFDLIESMGVEFEADVHTSVFLKTDLSLQEFRAMTKHLTENHFVTYVGGRNIMMISFREIEPMHISVVFPLDL